MDRYGKYDQYELILRFVRNLLILGLVTIMCFFIIDSITGAFDLVYAQTNGYYVSENNEHNNIDIINFVDNKILEITIDGESSKVTYEKVDPVHFKFLINHNGEIVEYVGEVIKEDGNFHIVLSAPGNMIELIKSSGV